MAPAGGVGAPPGVGGSGCLGWRCSKPSRSPSSPSGASSDSTAWPRTTDATQVWNSSLRSAARRCSWDRKTCADAREARRAGAGPAGCDELWI